MSDILCEYGCGMEANYQLKNGKWCCRESQNSCPGVREKMSEAKKGVPKSEETKKKMSEAKIGVPKSKETRKKMSEAQRGIPKGPCSEETKKKMSKSHEFTIDQIKAKYPTFSKVEEMRENENGEIQVHCKNNRCENSKEKGGWFTPKNHCAFKNRIWALEKNDGNDGVHFYCSDHCKDTCSLYGVRSDPLKENNLPYTLPELAELRRQVLERDKNICQYCGEEGDTVHHTRPVKLEPFLALDAVYAITVCKTCHHKYGHKKGTICSTGNLAAQTCNPESQKFLKQEK